LTLTGPDLLEHRIELELAHQIGHCGLIDALPGEAFRLDVERHFCLDSHQLASEFHLLPMLTQKGGQFRAAPKAAGGDCIKVRQQMFDIAEFLNQRGGGLFTDAWDTFDVIDRVTGESLDIHQRGGLYAEPLPHLAKAGPLVTHGIPQSEPGTDELHEVLVRRHYRRHEATLDCARRQGADDVVGLEAVVHYLRDAKRVNRAVNERNLNFEVIWSRRAIALVVFGKVVPKGPFCGVKHDCDVTRPRIFEQLHQHPNEAVNRVDRHAPRIVQLGQCMEGAEDISRAIYQDQFAGNFRHALKLPDAFVLGNEHNQLRFAFTHP